MKKTISLLFIFIIIVTLTGFLVAKEKSSKTKTVKLCDGETKVTVETDQQGPLSEEQARLVAQKLMAEYRAKKAEEAKKQNDPHSRRERMIWERELKKFVQEGYRLFHDWKALGGTNGVSCDMCHPDGSNTHPQTYPKFQKQLKRVALLRDMINWCLENTMDAKPLPEDDIRMKALEAYIHWQNRGGKFEPGRH